MSDGIATAVQTALDTATQLAQQMQALPVHPEIYEGSILSPADSQGAAAVTVAEARRLIPGSIAFDNERGIKMLTAVTLMATSSRITPPSLINEYTAFMTQWARKVVTQWPAATVADCWGQLDAETRHIFCQRAAENQDAPIASPMASWALPTDDSLVSDPSDDEDGSLSSRVISDHLKDACMISD